MTINEFMKQQLLSPSIDSDDTEDLPSLISSILMEDISPELGADSSCPSDPYLDTDGLLDSTLTDEFTDDENDIINDRLDSYLDDCNLMSQANQDTI